MLYFLKIAAFDIITGNSHYSITPLSIIDYFLLI